MKRVDPVTGNPVAYYSSDATGNGGVVGGNGTSWNNTPSPLPRADTVQALLAAVGKGRDK